LKFDFKDDGNKSFDNSNRAGANSECNNGIKSLKEKHSSALIKNDRQCLEQFLSFLHNKNSNSPTAAVVNENQ
jgi:hypothetical protein